MAMYYFERCGAAQPGDVVWSHAVDSREKLDRSLRNPTVMIIESDIRISSAGIAIAAHPPETESGLTFDELIGRMQGSKKGLKLDFKDPGILIGCLEKLQEISLSQPVLLNADILQGNGASPPKFDAVGFLSSCKRYYPTGILSVGWTTSANPNENYTKQNVDDMLKLCHGLREAIFPIRACLLPGSYREIERLVEKDGRTATLWNNEPVSGELLGWIRANTDSRKTSYDLIDENGELLRIY